MIDCMRDQQHQQQQQQRLVRRPTSPLMLGRAFHLLVTGFQRTPVYCEVLAPWGGGEASSGSCMKAGALGSLLIAFCADLVGQIRHSSSNASCWWLSQGVS